MIHNAPPYGCIPKSFKFDVFLSHNSADKEIVRKIAETLRDSGFKVWFDEWVIEYGDDIFFEIEKGLEESQVLLLFLSEKALINLLLN